MSLLTYAMPIGIIALTAGALASTNWLIALGAPALLIGLLPCAAMCALGMCHRKSADAGAASRGTSVDQEAK